MRYVDGFLIAVPKKKLAAYARMARMGRDTWMKHGALDYKECVADDLQTKWGTPFSRLLKLKAGETAIFAYIVYKSKADRDRINAKVMQEMQAQDMKDMPFEMKRMSFGGFKVLVDA